MKTITINGKEIPANLVLQIPENREIEQAAALEAAMTFMKQKNNEADAAKVVFTYPDLIQTKEELFLFAMNYGGVLAKLQEGLLAVPAQVAELFETTKMQNS